LVYHTLTPEEREPMAKTIVKRKRKMRLEASGGEGTVFDNATVVRDLGERR